jgi:nitroreductase
MTRKSLITFITATLTAALAVNAQTGNNDVIASILTAYSAKEYSIEPVTETEIEQIIKCGIKAPSGGNRQPWRFTVVKDTALTRKMIPAINDGNVIILISGIDTELGKANVHFNCALATQNMYIAAQSLGLGARIYGGPVRKVNEGMKDLLEIPEGYSVVSLLRIGNVDPGIDAVSSASPRQPMDSLINFK